MHFVVSTVLVNLVPNYQNCKRWKSSHVTPKGDEYQKSVCKKFKYCLGVSQFTIVF